MKCRFPVVDLEGSYAMAILLCETWDQHVGLLLHAAPDTELQDPSRKKYYTGYAFSRSILGRPQSCRIAYLGSDLHNLQF